MPSSPPPVDAAPGATGRGVKLTAHHLIGLRDGGSNDPANGVALCGSCHAKVEAERRA